MNGPVDRLTLDFLQWLAHQPRTYAQTMDAWRTSCPRLTVWEDALQAGLVQVHGAGSKNQASVTVTPRGKSLLQQHRS